MKIAFVRTASNILKYGGYNIQEIGLAKALLKYDVSTDVYARFSNVDKVTEVACEEKNRVEVHPLVGKQIYREIMYYPSLKKDLCEGGYDIVQLLDDSQMMLPMLFKALKNQGVKTILWQGMYRNFPAKPARMMQMVYDLLLAKTLDFYSDLKIAKTEAAKEYLSKKHYHNIITLPVGLDSVEYQVNSAFDKIIDDFKKQNPFILLYIGAVEKRRNPHFLIDLFNSWDRDGGGLIVIGKGPMKDELKKEIALSHKKEKILYFESVPNKELISVYKRANVFLLPTNYEIYGMVVMEALSMGIPVISTPEAGPQYILGNERLGKCLPLRKEEWISSIEFYGSNYTSSDDNIYRIQYVENHFRWPLIAERYYDILRNLYAGKLKIVYA